MLKLNFMTGMSYDGLDDRDDCDIYGARLLRPDDWEVLNKCAVCDVCDDRDDSDISMSITSFMALISCHVCHVCNTCDVFDASELFWLKRRTHPRHTVFISAFFHTSGPDPHRKYIIFSALTIPSFTLLMIRTFFILERQSFMQKKGNSTRLLHVFPNLYNFKWRHQRSQLLLHSHLRARE
jgi:hypothetical protein